MSDYKVAFRIEVDEVYTKIVFPNEQTFYWDADSGAFKGVHSNMSERQAPYDSNGVAYSAQIRRPVEDYLQLAEHLLNLDASEASEIDVDIIETKLLRVYGISSLDDFQTLMDDIMPLIPALQSSLTGDYYHVVGTTDDKGVMTALAKVPRRVD